jgi:ELWxxDGT repeat protein
MRLLLFSLFFATPSAVPVLIHDVVTGVSSSDVESVTAYKGLVFFVARGEEGKELWSSDGTSEGTKLVSDIHPGSDSSWPQYLFVYNEWLYFSADDGVVGCDSDALSLCGRELWKTDGVGSRTHRFLDVAVGEISGEPKGFVIYKNLLYFSATDGIHGRELWVTDGEPAVGNSQKILRMISDINTGADDGNPLGMVVYNRHLYFSATDGTHGTELWKSDGTSHGTSLVKDINTGAASSFPANFALSGCLLFFSANTPAFGVELWRSNGYDEGTFLLKDIFDNSYSSNPARLFLYGGYLYFSANGGTYGNELWRTDGTPLGTVLFKDSNPGTGSSDPSNFFEFNNRLFFTAKTPTTGHEMWTSDGTIDGTWMVVDIFPGPESGALSNFASVRGKIFFAGQDSQHGVELYGTQICKTGEYGSPTATSCAACAYGKYNDRIEALSCKLWSACAPGTHISFVGNGTTDRTCVPCLAGKASAIANQQHCYDWTICSSSQFETQGPSASTDRLCENCPAGTYTLEHNGNTCLSLFDHACHSDWDSLNWKMQRFCKDLYNLTRPKNSTIQRGDPGLAEIFDDTFLVFISISALVGSATSVLITVCILTHHHMRVPTLGMKRTAASTQKKSASPILHVNKPWEHVLEDYLTKPGGTFLKTNLSHQKVSPSRRTGVTGILQVVPPSSGIKEKVRLGRTQSKKKVRRDKRTRQVGNGPKKPITIDFDKALQEFEVSMDHK